VHCHGSVSLLPSLVCVCRPLIPPHNSLVRYDNPIQVSSSKDLGKAGTKALGKKDQKSQLTPTEDILNSILPPRSVLSFPCFKPLLSLTPVWCCSCSEWTEEGQLWVQYVSSTPATRSDVIALQAHLDQKLQSRQARETGICPIREELYAQCFGTQIECRGGGVGCFHSTHALSALMPCKQQMS
jgi:dynein light intermediate chain